MTTTLLEDGEFVGRYVYVMAYLCLPNTICNPFLLPKFVLDPLNRCVISNKLTHAIEGLKVIQSDVKHDLNAVFKINEMDKHTYLSAHQWLLQLYQTSLVNNDKIEKL